MWARGVGPSARGEPAHTPSYQTYPAPPPTPLIRRPVSRLGGTQPKCNVSEEWVLLEQLLGVQCGAGRGDKVRGTGLDKAGREMRGRPGREAGAGGRGWQLVPTAPTTQWTSVSGNRVHAAVSRCLPPTKALGCYRYRSRR